MTSAPLDPSDDRLIRRVVEANDDLAFRHLFRRHNDALYRFGLRLTGGSDLDAEEALQEAWARASTRLSTFEGRSAFRSWVSAILVRCVQEQRRRKNRPPPATELPAAISAPDHALRLDVEHALAAMPEGYRSVLVMAAEGFSHAEIALALGISEGTSKSQLSRGRRWLRDALDPQDPR